MDSIPTLSIGVPVYNGEQFIGLALESILNQTFTDFEVIISDNASTDRTLEICERYASEDSRIRIIKNDKNLGAAFNYNRTVTEARGQYFKWAAVDDLCATEFFQQCVNILEENSDIVLCYPKTKIIDQHGDVLKNYDDTLDPSHQSPVERFRQCLRMLQECNAVFGIMRTDIVRRTRRIDNYNGSDVILLAELSLYGAFYELPDYLFFRRTHPDCSSNLKSPDETLAWFDPRQKGKPHLSTWKHVGGYLSSVTKAPISVIEKTRLMVDILRYMRWQYAGLKTEARQAFRFMSNQLVRVLNREAA